ncbi:MAG: DUF1801 domain-containing protein [Deltaproteobacteria bacterium]|nr:DUF1801 domain-containing protein [Deltaproteobacteria bacterium]
MDASKRIDKEIAENPDWRGQTLANIRRIVLAADGEIIEEWKWMGTSCWSHDGLICAVDVLKDAVKVIFFKGANLPDPATLFNAELDGIARRAIKLSEGDVVDERALTTLIEAAVVLNVKTKAETPVGPKTKSRSAMIASKRKRP